VEILSTQIRSSSQMNVAAVSLAGEIRHKNAVVLTSSTSTTPMSQLLLLRAVLRAHRLGLLLSNPLAAILTWVVIPKQPIAAL
jgi:hypothetical protein